MKDRKIPKENEQKDKHELRNITQFKMNRFIANQIIENHSCQV
jgi:hypothetical protein